MPVSTGVTVLLVDDIPSIRKISSLMLLREGHEVTTAEDGLEALQLMQLHRYDVVLMDLQMPVLDGLEAVRRFREFERLEREADLAVNKIPKLSQFIVAVSANSEVEIAQLACDVGFNKFVEKPLSVEDFNILLREAGHLKSAIVLE